MDSVIMGRAVMLDLAPSYKTELLITEAYPGRETYFSDTKRIVH